MGGLQAMRASQGEVREVGIDRQGLNLEGERLSE